MSEVMNFDCLIDVEFSAWKVKVIVKTINKNMFSCVRLFIRKL